MMLKVLRAARGKGDAGFTVIELLVVVVIVGLLAAIAIPVFLGQRQKAFRATVQSDVRATVPFVASAMLASETPPNTVQSAGNRTVIGYPGPEGTYVIAGVHQGNPETAWCFDSETGQSGASEAVCQGLSVIALEQAAADDEADEEAPAGAICFTETDSAYTQGYDTGSWHLSASIPSDPTIPGYFSFPRPGCDPDWARGYADGRGGAGYNP